MDATSEQFTSRQREHFTPADTAHFAWQTQGPGFAHREAALLRSLLEEAPAPLLEIGCGEGGNLFHLTPQSRSGNHAPAHVGIDAFVNKLHFAAREIPAARFVCAAGESLPFPPSSFATVLIRDVLHHLPDPRAVLVEACRVLRPGGRFILVEPNVHNPLIRLQMAIVPAERGAARSDVAWLRRLLDGLPLDELHFEMACPLPLERVVLHYRFGWPALGRSRIIERLLDATNSLARRWMPDSRWSTVSLRATRCG